MARIIDNSIWEIILNDWWLSLYIFNFARFTRYRFDIEFLKKYLDARDTCYYLRYVERNQELVECLRLKDYEWYHRYFKEPLHEDLS